MDGRLWICGVAVAIAMFGLAWDFLYPFPLSRPVLIFCFAMQKDPAGLDPDSHWSASSNMMKYDDLYRLTLEFTDGKTGATRDTVVERSVGDFIDENGLICQDIVEPLVLKLHKSLSAGKKDK